MWEGVAGSESWWKRSGGRDERGLTGLPGPSIVLLIGEIEPKRFGDPAGEVVSGLP